MSGGLSGQEVKVDEDELNSIGDNSIEFINYVGPYVFTNTLDQIRNIGRALGDQISTQESEQASIGDKYIVLHIIDHDIPEGLDADIFIISQDAAVDHIVNLRHILAGYLETAYSFTGSDAYLVAEFITYYNAVYRGDTGMVAERYKAPVSEPLVQESIGLGTHYSEWPGQTQMLIPLRGLLDSMEIDTGPITEEAVIEEMRKNDDKGLDSRQAMVELREKELDRQQENLDTRKEELQKEEKLLTDSPDQQEKLEATKTALEKEQKEIDERTKDVMKMREDIAQDLNQNIAVEQSNGKKENTFVSAETSTPVWIITVDSRDEIIPFGRVVKYNADNGRKIAVSSVTAVRGRTMIKLPDTLLIIAGKVDANSRVRLMLLNQNDLSTIQEGKNDIFPGSQLISRGSDIYLITNEKGTWRIGKFTPKLQRTAISNITVNPWTSLFFDQDYLYVQGEDGTVFKLSVSNLEEVDQF